MIRYILIRFILVISGILVPVFILEAGIRFDQYLRKGIPLYLNPSSKWDPALGWTGTEHKLGSNFDKPILVIGDSFTEGMGIPAEKMWFSALRELSPDTGIIAYGGLGYGTLQELLVLENYLSKGIRPSHIIIQVCSNDIINNYFELEKDSYLQRAPAPRPYLEDKKVSIRFPRYYNKLIHPLISVSRIAYHYNSKWETLLSVWAGSGKIRSIEYDIQEKGYSLPAFLKAVRATSKLFKKIKKTAAGTKITFMLVDNNKPYTTAFIKIVKEEGLHLIIPFQNTEIPKSALLPDNAHFNEEGNGLLGRQFINLLQNS